MLAAEDPVLDGDGEHADDSPHTLQHSTSGDHEECEQDDKEENSEGAANAGLIMDAVAASSETTTSTPAHIEESNDAEPHDVAVITPEKPGRVTPKETSDTESSGSVSSSSHQMSSENEENESNAKIADQGDAIHIEEGNDAEYHDGAFITPEKRGRALLRETSDTKRSASVSVSSSSHEISNENEESENNAKIAKQSSQRSLSGEPNRRRSKSTPPSPPRTKFLMEESKTPTRGNLAFPEGKHFDAHFDACSVTEKALRLGLLIPLTEYEDETEAETRLSDILQAYRLHLERHIEPSVLADLIKITPRHSAGHRHATHQRRQEIFMLTFQATFHTAWHCRCESVCEGSQFYCMDSEKQLTFYRKQHNDHEPAEPNAQVCYSCYDELMVRGGEAPHLELSQSNLSTGMAALAKGCDACYADMVGEDLDSITSVGSSPDGINRVEESLPLSIGIGKASILNRQDDPFAPREGKTLVWTDVSMTLVCSRSLLFEGSARFDTSLTMILILS
jgi:hypothetical protein